jgi:ribonuclease D
MSKFKRVSLVGSEELFRPTRPEVLEEDVIADVLDQPPRADEQLHRLNLTSGEVDLLVEAVQLAKYPDKARPKPPLEKFERLDALKTKLQADQPRAS